MFGPRGKKYETQTALQIKIINQAVNNPAHYKFREKNPRENSLKRKQYLYQRQ